MFNNNLGLKRRIKLSVLYVAAGISLAYLFVSFEIQGWNQAVALGSQLFYQAPEQMQVTVPHAQDSIDNLLKWNFGSEAKLAKAIFRSESGLRCEAEGDGHLAYQKNGITYGGSYGIAQIRYLPGRPSPAQLKDCKFAIKYAKQIRDRSGWNVWSAYKNKSYLKFL